MELRYVQSIYNKINWHKLPNYSLQVSQLGFAFLPNNFFHEIVDKVTRNLNSGGIIDKILDECGFYRKKFKTEKKMSSLKMEKLTFGFVIWIVCCGICIVGFINEIFFWILKRKIEMFMNKVGISSQNIRLVQVSYAKIYPAKIADENFERNISKNTNLFRSQKSIQI